MLLKFFCYKLFAYLLVRVEIHLFDYLSTVSEICREGILEIRNIFLNEVNRTERFLKEF